MIRYKTLTCCFYFLILNVLPLITKAQTDAPFLGEKPFFSPFVLQKINTDQRHSAKTSEDTLSLVLPFFDSFTNIKYNIRNNSQFPDSLKWLVRRNVTITRNQAINPPDYGVATFDGMQGNGYAHSNSRFANTNVADSLLSHFINLEGLTADDNVFLSYYVQAGGTASAPRPESSFKLFLRDKRGIFQPFADGIFENNEYLGSKIDNSIFYQIHFNLDESYLHDKFQILFVNTSNLTNYGDVWHLDYVYLDKNRSRNDFHPDDVGFQGANMHRFPPYSACPLVLRKDTAFFDVQPDTAYIHNLSEEVKNFNLEYFVKDSLGSALKPLALTVQNDIKQGPEITQTYVMGYLDDAKEYPYQIFNLTEPKMLRQEWKITTKDSDLDKNNNRITVEYPTDSILAFDDGEFESSIGHNNPRRGLASRLHWRKSDTVYTRRIGTREYKIYYKSPDSIRAVWFSFYPRHEFIDTFLTFRIGFWRDDVREVIPIYINREDTLCLHDRCNFCYNFGKVNADNCHPKGPFHFYRYPIFPPLPIHDTTLLVGLIQNQAFRDVGFGVLLGRDVNTPNQGVYYQFQNEWRDINEYNNKNVGTPAMRFEISNNTSVWNKRTDKAQDISINIYPNPASSGILNLQFSGKGQGVNFSKINASITDLLGKELWKITLDPTNASNGWQIVCPENISDGVYFIKVQTESGETSQVYHQKILISR